MAEYPALPLFTDAFIADTTHLTAAQTGAFLMLLIIAWRTPDCALPNDDRILARYARMDVRTWMKNRDAVLAFWFQGEDQKWRQRRLLDERKYVDEMRDKKSHAGLASALKRKKRHSTPVPTERQQNGSTHTLPTSSEPKGSSDIPPPLGGQGDERSLKGKKFELPDWINPTDWRDYEEMRTRIKKPLTDRARTENIRDLQRLRDAGEDVHEVIGLTIKRCWAGFFSTKNRGGDREKGPVRLESFETKNYMDGSDGFLT
jgi:uncharacterized protein YdaU (DUF1376 family)